MTLRTYLEILGRRRLLIAGCIGMVTLLALFWSLLRTPTYTAKTAVLVRQPLLNTLDGAQQVDELINMSTQMALASSINVADLAAQRMATGTSSRELLENLTVTEVPDSHVLRFTFVASDPQVAATSANTLAQAYLDWREGASGLTSTDAYASLQSRATDIEGRLTQLDAALQVTDPESNAYETASLDRNIVRRELATIRRQLDEAAQLGTNPGEIIDPAEAPKAATSPNTRTNIITGIAFGALVGVLFALGRDRTDDRLVRRKDSLELLGMRVLGTVPRQRGVSVVKTGGAVAEAHRRLTSNVLILADNVDAKVLVVTSPNIDNATPSIAGHLAASAARIGKKVLIVTTNLRDSTLAQLFSVEHSPGLVAVIIGESTTAEAIRTNARFPNLDVLLGGRPVTQPAELLQTEAFRYFVRSEREKYDLVVIESPAINDFADTLTVAPFADGVVLTIEDGHSTRADVEYAKDQLERIGARIIGAVQVAPDDREFQNKRRSGGLTSTRGR